MESLRYSLATPALSIESANPVGFPRLTLMTDLLWQYMSLFLFTSGLPLKASFLGSGSCPGQRLITEPSPTYLEDHRVHIEGDICLHMTHHGHVTGTWETWRLYSQLQSAMKGRGCRRTACVYACRDVGTGLLIMYAHSRHGGEQLEQKCNSVICNLVTWRI